MAKLKTDDHVLVGWNKEWLGAVNGPYFYRGTHPRQVSVGGREVARLVIEVTPARKNPHLPAEWMVWLELTPPYPPGPHSPPTTRIARGEATGVATGKQAAIDWVSQAEDRALVALLPELTS